MSSRDYAPSLCVRVTFLVSADQSSLLAGSPNGFKAAKRMLCDSINDISNLST